MDKMLDKALQLAEKKANANAKVCAYIAAGMSIVFGGIAGGAAYVMSGAGTNMVIMGLLGGGFGALPGLAYWGSGQKWLDNKSDMIEKHRDWTENWTPDSPPVPRHEASQQKKRTSSSGLSLAAKAYLLNR